MDMFKYAINGALRSVGSVAGSLASLRCILLHHNLADCRQSDETSDSGQPSGCGSEPISISADDSEKHDRVGPTT